MTKLRLLSVLSVLGGALSLAAGAAQAADLPAGHAAAGAELFHQCMGCHAVGPSAQNGVGPELNGVVGRHAAGAPGFRYSSAMKASGLTWDTASLSRFLQSPADAVPGTRMGFSGLAQPQERADVIAYLQQYGQDGQHSGK